MALKSHGITEKTPENLLFSAGTIFNSILNTTLNACNSIKNAITQPI